LSVEQEFRPNGIVTLLSDFGEQDYYVPAMKGAMLRVCPTLRILDAGHHVPPQAIATASYLLARYALEYPEGTVHVVVVDPGVGSSREVLVAQVAGRLVVGPDNGFISGLARRCRRSVGGGGDPATQRPGCSDGRLPQLVSPQDLGCVVAGPMFRAADVKTLGFATASPTFHGRDVFAPLAAGLACGDLQFPSVGPLFEPRVLPEPRMSADGECIRSEVIHVDRFGNLVTGIREELLGGRTPCRLEVGSTRVERLVRTYSDAPDGSLVFLAGSGGELEVSEVGGSAAARLVAAVGSSVVCRLR